MDEFTTVVNEITPLLEKMLTAPVLNVLMILVFLSILLYLVVERTTKKLTKPYEELNIILIRIADGLQQQIVNNAVDEKERELRDAKYMGMQKSMKETILRELDDIERVVERIDTSMTSHTAFRCYHHKKEVGIDETE